MESSTPEYMHSTTGLSRLYDQNTMYTNINFLENQLKYFKGHRRGLNNHFLPSSEV